MRERAPDPRTGPSPRRGEAALYAGLVLALCVVAWPVLLHPGEVLHGPLSDVLAGHHPYRVLQRNALAAWGSIALWDPTTFGGMPLISDPQSQIFYPPHWLHLLGGGREGEAWYGRNLLLHLIVAATGMAWWLRGHGLSRPARFAGAATFALSGKWLFHVLAKGHIGFLAIAWLPWQLGLIDRVSEQPTARRVGGLALSVALMVLGAHPQMALYGLLITAAYGAFSLWQGDGGASLPRRVSALAGAALLAVALSCVYWLPVIDGADQFVRGEGFGLEDAVKRSLQWRELVAFFVPTQLELESGPAVFVGAGATLLALCSLADRRRRPLVLFFFALVVAMVGYGLGENGPVFGLFYHAVPGFDLVRYPNRMAVMLGLPTGLLVASGVTVAAGWARGPRWPGALAWALAALILVDQARLAMPRIATASLDEALGENPVVQWVAAPLGTSRVYAFDETRNADVSSLPVTYATRAGIEIIRGLNPLVPAATAYYLYHGAGGLGMASEHEMTIRTFPIRSRPHLDLFNVRWIVTQHPLRIPGLEQRAVIEDLTLYHFQRREGLVTIPTTYVYENVEAMPRAWLAREARRVKDAVDAIDAIGDLDFRHTVLLEDPDQIASYPGEYVPVPIEHRGDEILARLDAGAGGYLVLSEVYFPGWHAEVDGEPAPVLPANGIFRALHLGAGEHTVRLWYAPRAWHVGLAVSGAALVGLLGMLLTPLLRRIRPRRLVDAATS